ncbi:hypothetical protein WEB32_34730 [Streptomyces netropsis]|uniref:hypothetical protein n=1 Tax=Streptomyces netropsis TaxID=55404 RepID=UPI0030D5D07B
MRHRSHTVDVNDLVNELLELLARISDDLDVLRHRLDRAPKGRPLAPGRVETATTLVAALLMGVQERNVGEKTALDPAEAALRETAALQGELDTAPCSKQDLQGRARATARCRQLRTFLKAARSLVAKLFADGGEQSCLLPVPAG